MQNHTTRLPPKEIQLKKGKVALVDAEDYERLSRHHWTAVRGGGDKGYWGRSSLRAEFALDEDARVRECVVLTDERQADELYDRLRGIWGGANVAMASRKVDAIPLNLEEKIAPVTEIIQ